MIIEVLPQAGPVQGKPDNKIFIIEGAALEDKFKYTSPKCYPPVEKKIKILSLAALGSCD